MPYPCGFPETNVSKGENLVAHAKNGILGKNHITGGARGAAWRVQTGTCEALEWNVTSILEALPFRLPGALPQNIWIRPWVLHPVFLSWWWGPGLSQSTSDDREFSTRNILQGTSGYEWKWVPLILNSKYVCVLFVGALPWKDLLETVFNTQTKALYDHPLSTHSDFFLLLWWWQDLGWSTWGDRCWCFQFVLGWCRCIMSRIDIFIDLQICIHVKEKYPWWNPMFWI